eukprot:56502-Chlamydomonas_euryale.AAC.6
MHMRICNRVRARGAWRLARVCAMPHTKVQGVGREWGHRTAGIQSGEFQLRVQRRYQVKGVHYFKFKWRPAHVAAAQASRIHTRLHASSWHSNWQVQTADANPKP